MTQEFCEHLDEYGVAFGRAKASYGNCLNLVDKIIEDPEMGELRKTLENSLDDWVLETRKLRELFSKMIKAREIELVPNEDQENMTSLDSRTAQCRACSFQIPRLEFPEFNFEDEENPTYRGQSLPLPAGAGA